MFQNSQITTFDDDFIHFFDVPKLGVNSEAKDDDNQGDELLKLVDEAINNTEVQVKGDPLISKSDTQIANYIYSQNDHVKRDSVFILTNQVREGVLTPTNHVEGENYYD